MNDNQPKAKNTSKKDDFLDNTATSANNQAIDIAVAVGEAIAKQLGNLKQSSNPSTAATVAIEIEKKAQAVGDKQAAFAKRIAEDKDNYVNIMIPQIYAQFEPSMTVSINGCTIKIPADGVTRKVHKVYAAEILSRLRYTDKKIQEMRANNNIAEITQIV